MPYPRLALLLESIRAANGTAVAATVSDITQSFNKRIQTLEPRHFETQANMALNSVHVPRPAAFSLTSLR